MITMKKAMLGFCFVVFCGLFASPSFADGFPLHSELQTALRTVVKESNGGFGFNMWATIVDRDGIVKAVAYSGNNRGDQWPGSRIISAQKANTANAFSLPGLALSTANLYSAVQPGGSLYGLQFSNPVDTAVAYRGPSEAIGTEKDPREIGDASLFNRELGVFKFFSRSKEILRPCFF